MGLLFLGCECAGATTFDLDIAASGGVFVSKQTPVLHAPSDDWTITVTMTSYTGPTNGIVGVNTYIGWPPSCFWLNQPKDYGPGNPAIDAPGVYALGGPQFIKPCSGIDALRLNGVCAHNFVVYNPFTQCPFVFLFNLSMDEGISVGVHIHGAR